MEISSKKSYNYSADLCFFKYDYNISLLSVDV